MTATLHIEHPITDAVTWKKAFDAFASVRAGAGVRSERIHRPIDDGGYVLVQLEFDTVAEAERFLSFLQSEVWSSPDRAPALAGSPHPRILEPLVGE
jgi:hypothetical protein